MTALPPLSLYLHLPWCVRKCPYCDFNSHAAGAGTDKPRYVTALLDDLRRESTTAAGRTVGSVFLGGGTPSFFSAAEIGAILDAASSNFRLAGDVEITMEANPGTVERGCLSDYRRAGVNRLSLGAQSFNDEALRRLGRIHGAEEIVTAWRDARAAGFDSINIDLMFALPGQNAETAVADIDEAVRLSPEHISWYQLTLEPNTRFHAQPPADLPDEDLAFEIEERGRARLLAAGYEQYEVSAFARPGFRCRHNLNYWRFGDYLGIGAGAHGKLTGQDGAIWRSVKPLHPRAYMEEIESGRPQAAPRKLAADDAAFEYLLNVLRLSEGFTGEDFVARTGEPFDTLVARIERAVAAGLLMTDGAGRWRPSRRGRLFLNDLQAMFLPDRASPGLPSAAAEAAAM